ncbi:MAG: sigma-70 family RNA polymerase sigma factor [Elainellaceae cyanobacterium]
MRARQSITETFSTFLQFDSDRFQNWIVDSRLHRSMKRLLHQASQTEISENYWALYWHKAFSTSTSASSPDKPNSIAREHLVAYIQEPCYWVAQKTTASFSNIPYTLADCFQMAIAQIDKVLQGFDPQQGFSLKNYAAATLASLIREGLRQRQEVDICTDWALLRKLSQKRLTEALQQAGFMNDKISTYMLAWHCFKTLYVPQQASGTRKLARPESTTWEAIVQYYNQERDQTAQPPTTPEAIESWLLTCAKAARDYLYPQVISINTPKPGQGTGELLDDLSETAQADSLLTDSLLNELIAAEEIQTRQAQQQQLNAVLTAALQHLDSQSQQLVQLYYRDELTQQQMAERLGTKQYTVSRRLTKAREILLLTLAKWSQETLHITPTSDLLSYTSAALEEWLNSHFQRNYEG